MLAMVASALAETVACCKNGFEQQHVDEHAQAEAVRDSFSQDQEVVSAHLEASGHKPIPEKVDAGGRHLLADLLVPAESRVRANTCDHRDVCTEGYLELANLYGAA